MRIRRGKVELSLPETIAIAKRQSEYQSLVREFSSEVIDLLGGIDGDASLRKRAEFDLSVKLADCISAFVLEHSR